MPPVPVLIVGAGPSGLNLALALIRRSVQCRIISEADGPGEKSRAMVVQARTLEFYGQYGFAGEVVERGVVAETAHVREGGSSGSREVLSIGFKEMGAGLSPYPFALAYPQDDHERFLIEKLKNAGCEVEWGANAPASMRELVPRFPRQISKLSSGEIEHAADLMSSKHRVLFRVTRKPRESQLSRIFTVANKSGWLQGLRI